MNNSNVNIAINNTVDASRLERLSKTLSWLLRHKALESGLQMREDGYIKLDSVMKVNEIKQFKPTLEDIKHCVDTDKKNRFSLTEINHEKYIRANQGHSIKGLINYDQMMKQITLENVTNYTDVIHGTYFNAWNTIKDSGLKPMGREQIHFANGIDAQSGIRKECTVRIYIDLLAAVTDGIVFYESENGVILTNQEVPPKYFKQIDICNR